MLFSNGPDKAFLVPDSCRATERNGNSTSANVTNDIIENDSNGLCFSYFQMIWQVSWSSLYRRINKRICTFSLDIKLICIRCETGNNNSPIARFFYLFLKLVQINVLADWLILLCLTPLSAIYQLNNEEQLYHGNQF